MSSDFDASATNPFFAVYGVMVPRNGQRQLITPMTTTPYKVFKWVKAGPYLGCQEMLMFDAHIALGTDYPTRLPIAIETMWGKARLWLLHVAADGDNRNWGEQTRLGNTYLEAYTIPFWTCVVGVGYYFAPTPYDTTAKVSITSPMTWADRETRSTARWC